MSLTVPRTLADRSLEESWQNSPPDLPRRVVQDVSALVSRTSRDPGRALAVLELLSRSARPMSRNRVGSELGLPASALARTISLLDENGFVHWTKRFGVGLGVRFLEYGEPFTGHLDRGFLCLVEPYLDLLALECGGTSFVALRAGQSLLVPRASGLGDSGSVAADNGCLRVAEHASSRPWSSVEPWVFRPVPGVWATREEDDQVAIAARVTLSHSAASIGLRRPMLTVADYEACCRELGRAALQLTSALRRQFPQ